MLMAGIEIKGQIKICKYLYGPFSHYELRESITNVLNQETENYM